VANMISSRHNIASVEPTLEYHQHVEIARCQHTSASAQRRALLLSAYVECDGALCVKARDMPRPRYVMMFQRYVFDDYSSAILCCRYYHTLNVNR